MANKHRIIMLMAVLLIPIVFGRLDCFVDETPVIQFNQNIVWSCSTDQDYCLSYMSYNNSLYQLNPERTATAHVGIIDKFEVQNGIVNPFWTSQNLRRNMTVTFGVVCGNETYEHNVTPQTKEYFEVIDRSVWVMDNAGYLIGAVFMVIIIIIIISMIIRAW